MDFSVPDPARALLATEVQRLKINQVQRLLFTPPLTSQPVT